MKIAMVAAGLALSSVSAIAQEEYSESFKTGMQHAITSEKYKCEGVKTIIPQGADARGDVLKVGCLVEGAGMTNRIYYLVTLTTDDDLIVKPVD